MEEKQDKTKNLQNFKKFLEYDMKIKEELLSLAPTDFDEYDEDRRIKYVDKLYKALENLETEFLLSIKDIKVEKSEQQNWQYKKFEVNLKDELQDSIEKYFSNVKSKLEIGTYNPGICKKLYRETISSIGTNYVEKVKESCVGYGGENRRISSVNNLIMKTQTTNELLHLIHSYIVNNEYILQSFSVISQKENTIHEKITWYGEKNEIAQKIFDEFPVDLDCGITDIISLENKVLMMIRDRGHALSVDIDTSNEDIMIKYFVPKTFTWIDRSFMEELPGINSKTITQNGAMGSFVSSKENLVENLVEFIDKVPTDDIAMKKYSSKAKQQDINQKQESMEQQ